MSERLPLCQQLRDGDETVALADSGMDFALVAARFYPDITGRLIEGAVQTLTARGADMDNIELIEVPGAFEIPAAVDLCIEAEQFDAVIALGCVLRGQTPHFEHIAGACARGVAQMAQRGIIPVTFGVLTCDSREQAERRSALLENWAHPRDEGPDRNVGAEAAAAALEMIEVFADWADDDDDDDGDD